MGVAGSASAQVIKLTDFSELPVGDDGLRLLQLARIAAAGSRLAGLAPSMRLSRDQDAGARNGPGASRPLVQKRCSAERAINDGFSMRK